MHLREQLSNLAAPVVRLFESLSRGDIQAVLATEPRASAVPKSNRHRRLSSSEIDQLVRDYCSGAGSVYELAVQWRVHRNTIARHLRDRGLELGKAQLSSDESTRAVELWDQGLSLNAIGRAIGRDPKTAKKAVAEHLANESTTRKSRFTKMPVQGRISADGMTGSES